MIRPLAVCLRGRLVLFLDEDFLTRLEPTPHVKRSRVNALSKVVTPVPSDRGVGKLTTSIIPAFPVQDTHEHSRENTGVLGVFDPTGHGSCCYQQTGKLRYEGNHTLV